MCGKQKGAVQRNPKQSQGTFGARPGFWGSMQNLDAYMDGE
jgi:hypothetical protein